MMNDLSPQFQTLVWSALTILFIAVGSYLLGKGASTVARWRGMTPTEQRRVFWGFLFAAPWIIGFVIFVVGPALASLYYSLTDYKLGETANWVGLENYRTLLMGEGAHGRRFTQAMFNSFYYALVGVPLQVGASLLMAMVLNQQLRGVRIFRLIFYLPVILAGGPAILLAWRYMLAANGGFVNEISRGLADHFFLFDWLYRAFIYVVEAFNSFYAGVAQGDPIGPLKYLLPALIGLLALLTLAFGEWTPSKRGRAWQIAEIVAAVTLSIAFARGLIAQPLEPALIYAVDLLVLAGIYMAYREDNVRRARLWQVGGLAAAAVGFLIILLLGSPDDRALFLPVFVITAVPVAITAAIRQEPLRKNLLLVTGGILCVLILARLVPGQLTGSGWQIFPQYLTLQTSLAQPDNPAYLKAFGESTPSALWLYGAVALVIGGVGLLNNRYPRAQRVLLYGSLLVFGLLTVGSLLDGIRYFQAFDQIAAATGGTNYHFATFAKSISAFPDQTRAPLWLSSELWSKPSLILITMWSSGAGMLIFLAALKGVPQVFYEAAEVDGATRWQKFVKITLPMISPAMFYNIVIGVIAALQTFDAIYIISNTNTQDSLASAAFFLFTRTFRQLAIGQGAAVSWILAGIIVLLTTLQFRYNRWVYYEN
jgi:ABC-type sugar transport system permease subunit